MAQIGHGLAKFLATLRAVLVATSYINYVLVFFKIDVYLLHELIRNLELRKDRVLVNLVPFDFLRNFKRIADYLRMLREERKHFLCALHVFLLGIAHPVRVVHIHVRSEADEPVVCRAVLFSHEMYVVGRNYLCAGLFCKEEDSGVGLHLILIYFQ